MGKIAFIVNSLIDFHRLVLQDGLLSFFYRTFLIIESKKKIVTRLNSITVCFVLNGLSFSLKRVLILFDDISLKYSMT